MKLRNSIVLFAGLLSCGYVSAGQIFITGHDPVWHAGLGGNTTGAANIAGTGIEYARAGSALPFLFIESKTVAIPSGNEREASFLGSALSYASSDYQVMDAADLNALPDFRTALNSYSAIVVASDHGGMLTMGELSFLNGHSADIIDYLNTGGGLFASAQSNSAGLIGSTPRFGFLPFLVSSTDFNSPEDTNTVTAFGASLGLIDADVNGNFSHNYFASTGGMNAVDLFNGDSSIPLTLAYTGLISVEGVVPEPGAFGLLGLGMICLQFARRKRH